MRNNVDVPGVVRWIMPTRPEEPKHLPSFIASREHTLDVLAEFAAAKHRRNHAEEREHFTHDPSTPKYIDLGGES